MPLLPGDIVFVHVNSLQNPKEKFAVLACLDPQPMLLLISTELTGFKQNNPVLRAEQIVVDCKSHPCLRYDSWLDCTEPHSCGGLLMLFEANPKVRVGHVSPGLRANIIEVVASSKTLSQRNIKRFLDALTS